MDITGLIVFLAIGAIAGWLGSTIMKGGGFGLLGNIVIGILGAIVGGFLFGVGMTLGSGCLSRMPSSTSERRITSTEALSKRPSSDIIAIVGA